MQGQVRATAFPIAINFTDYDLRIELLRQVLGNMGINLISVGQAQADRRYQYCHTDQQYRGAAPQY